MKHFFLIDQDHWTAKNKLHEAINAIARHHSGTLTITDEDKKLLIHRIKMAIDAANKAHPRCKAFECSVWRNNHMGYDVISVPGVFRIIVHPISKEYGKQVSSIKKSK